MSGNCKSHTYSISELRTHSTNIRTVGTQVTGANTAAAAARAGVAPAYGWLFGSLVAPAIEHLVGSVTEFGDTLSEMITDTGDSAQRAAENYEACEADAEQAIHTITQDLESMNTKWGVK